jgi:hypothetical protein
VTGSLTSFSARKGTRPHSTQSHTDLLAASPALVSPYQQHEEQSSATRRDIESYIVLADFPEAKPAKRSRKNKHSHLSEAERVKAVAD